MLSYNDAFYELKSGLQPLYDEREAVAIAHEVMRHITGLDKTQRLLRKEDLFSAEQRQRYEQMRTSLLRGKPLQYVTGSAWFRDKEYYVNENVLIPRPETEELVQWIVDDFEAERPKLQILDVGTGSGCIPISLKLAMPDAMITGCDISGDALTVAKKNAGRLQADVQFVKLDFLNTVQSNELGTYDVIVSNPPYIPAEEKERLHRNVKDYEPGIALFVPDSDALVFYKAIALFGKEHLSNNGYIYCELDAAHAEECKALFEGAGYKKVEIRKDMHGNWRMLKAKLAD